MAKKIPDSQHAIWRETEIEIHVVQQFVHQTNHLNDHLVLTHIVTILDHHLQSQMRALVAIVLVLAMTFATAELRALVTHWIATVTTVVFLDVR